MINPKSISCERFFPKKYVILDIEETENKYVFWLMTDSFTAKCPECGKTSNSAHSNQQKEVQDLPILGKSVYLNVSQVRYFCKNNNCDVHTFTERNEFLLHNKTYTTRCSQYMLKVATHVNCEAASKILAYQGIKVSGDTLINMLKEAGSKYEQTPVRVMGVDDWAYRKGQNYGSIICDMETREVIDILEGRDAETLEKWLSGHPEIEIVSRDRASNYSSAVTNILPEAVQIADRFHITKNLLEALDAAIKESLPQKIEIPITVVNETEQPATHEPKHTENKKKRRDAKTSSVATKIQK